MRNSRSADTSHSALSLSRVPRDSAGLASPRRSVRAHNRGHLVRCLSLGFIRMKGDMVHLNVEICAGGR